jgi:uncharacterized protein (DUF2062 family)
MGESLGAKGTFRRYFNRVSRYVYKLLRHPRRRKQSRLHNWMAERVFDRAMWKPSRERVAKGLAIGLFLALIPIPVQMAAGVTIASWKRWNVPSVILGTWLTNPLTLWIYYFPFKLGVWIFESLGIEVAGGWAVVHNMTTASELSFHSLGEAFTVAQAWFLGCILMGGAVAGIGYGLAYFLWGALSHVHLPAIPHPKQKKSVPSS